MNRLRCAPDIPETSPTQNGAQQCAGLAGCAKKPRHGRQKLGECGVAITGAGAALGFIRRQIKQPPEEQSLRVVLLVDQLDMRAGDLLAEFVLGKPDENQPIVMLAARLS